MADKTNLCDILLICEDSFPNIIEVNDIKYKQKHIPVIKSIVLMKYFDIPLHNNNIVGNAMNAAKMYERKNVSKSPAAEMIK